MNKTWYNRILLICIGFLLILSLFLGSEIIKNNQSKSEALDVYISQSTPGLEHKELGEIKSIIEYGDNSAIAVHYPILGQNKVDESIKTTIENYIDEFNLLVRDMPLDAGIYKGELNIDYEIYSAIEDIVSIKFTILEDLPYYAHPNIEIYTITFDLSNGKELSLKDIFKGKYLQTISDMAIDYLQNEVQYQGNTDTENFYQGLDPMEENYSIFLLCDEYVSFIFQKYQLFPGYLGIPEVKIPYDVIQDYLRPRFINTNSKETFSADKDSIELEIIQNRKVDANMPMVALTFDDGPYIRATIPILDTLREHDSVATFFVLGNRVSGHRDIVKRIVSEGSEIGNHSFNHKQLTTISSKEIKTQIDQTQNAVIEVVGIEPKVMRPTYGSYDKKLKSQVGMPMILWSIDTEDWKSKSPDKIVKHVLDNIQDGDIVLMHDIFSTTAEAVEQLVPDLINRGFQLVTVSELYEIRGEVLEVGNIYSRKR